jgi:hypothetical protein
MVQRSFNFGCDRPRSDRYSVTFSFNGKKTVNNIMKATTKSLLESLTNILPEKDRSLIIESRGLHVIAAATTLLESIEEYFGESIAEEMEKRLLSSIKNRNPLKFTRGTQKITESKKPTIN